MSENYLPTDIPTIYRGGKSVTFQPHEIKIDKETGQLKATHGISVDADAEAMVKFGGAYRVVAIPTELKFVQRGKRTTHFEIVPKSPMSPQRYQELLNAIELEEVNDEQE